MAAGGAPSRNLGARAVLCPLFFYLGSATATSESFRCSVPDAYADAELQALTSWNCKFVDAWQVEVQEAIDEGLHEIVDSSEEQRAAWLARSNDASQLCTEARQLEAGGDHRQAANLSVNAWGSVVRQGATCCTLLDPPYCAPPADSDWSASTVALLVPLAILVFLVMAVFLTSCRTGAPSKEEAKPKSETERASSFMSAAPDVDRGRAHLYDELETAWMKHSCLRVLPHAASFSRSTASLFAALADAFHFQADNAKNQHEHLLSLWRSQLSMVADKAYEDPHASVNEQDLLKEALGDLHAELLDGFLRWRRNLYTFEAAGVVKQDRLPQMCGARWEPLANRSGGVDEELSRQLAEIVTFLLVWGEAGNLRFMPEVLYFITDLALASEPCDPRQLYQLPSSEDAGESGLFLAKIVRPLYNMVFDEWYEKVDVKADDNPCNQKDVKKLREGYEAYLPGDVANYDDWNEFFCDPARLTDGLLLEDGKQLFEHPRGQRFRQLAAIDWGVSLEARSAKTHNELHSLWGVFASTHRICLLHMVMFATSLCVVCDDPPQLATGHWPLGGDKPIVRFAAVGLLVPLHALAWSFAEWQITGAALRSKWGRCGPCLKFLGAVQEAVGSLFQPMCGCPDTGKWYLWALLRKPPLIVFLLPLATFALLRKSNDEEADFVYFTASLHYLVSAFGLVHLLLVPSTTYNRFPFETASKVPLSSRLVRYGFWGCILAVKFALGLIIIKAISDAMTDLRISRPGHESTQEISQLYYSAAWGDDVLLWTVLWGATFTLYLADTQLWFTVFSTLLGIATTFVQRHRAARSGSCCPAGAIGGFMFEDAIAKIPQRFSQKVLYFTSMTMGKESGSAPFSQKFPAIWDRIMQYMSYEDKVSSHQMGDMSFDVGATGQQVYWDDLSKPVEHRRQGGVGDVETGDGTTKQRVKVPQIFVENPFTQRCLQTYAGFPGKHFPHNPDAQWRMLALSRGLGLPMPRPYRAPYMPGITVLIPHYGETILMQKKELFNKAQSDNVPLIDWLTHRYRDEFEWFTTRMQARQSPEERFDVVGSEWEKYSDYQWGKVSNWAAMRQQTLFRTVAGMCYYYPAIQAHFELQGDKNSSLASVWDASDVFTCMVTMQMYKFFDKTMLEHTNYMFDKFPKCFKVAFIDCEDKGAASDADGVHQKQKRRYYSCLIDRFCEKVGDRRKPKFRIELPGYPILGDGKGDNQNHAIPFMRGHYSQGIDANQGAYFEQMMLLPCALGEFRSHKRGDGSGKKILGFPEHITSDIGSVGDFAASAEVAFGTILQRTYAVLGARMHYGHPDIMNKLYMMQQGGVSKATKTLNLSEDIFAGMDFTLRGDGRQIKHCEYLNLAKGRDLGFNTVLGFFSKLSSGTGEQLLTRQTFRLGQVLHLPEALAFFYAHAGYYLNQFIVSWSMPLLVFVWLLVLLSDCEGKLDAFLMCEDGQKSAAAVMAGALATCYSWLMLLFLFATSFPLFAELWMQRSFKTALWKMVQSYLTLSPFLFIFQSKCIGHYIVNEFRYGGATYVATGRGLPTERRPFVGEVKSRSEGFLKMHKVGGLYLDYATISYYDGAMLLVGLIFVVAAGGIPSDGGLDALTWMFVSCGLVLVAWLYGPFIFNPYQFELKHFKDDGRALCAFFLENNGSNWLDWYNRTQLKSGHRLQKTLVDIAFFGFIFIVAAWYVTVTVKVELLASLFSEYKGYTMLYLTVLLPPVFVSFGFCVCVAVVEICSGCSSSIRRSVEARVQARQKKRHGTGAGSPTAAEDPEAGGEGATRAEDFAARAPAASRIQPSPLVEKLQRLLGCALGVPMPATALLVVAMDAAEVAFALRDIYFVGWKNALLAGVVLKLTLLSAAIVFGEGVLRSELYAKVSAHSSAVALPLAMWVRAHRMARDIFTSAIIFVPLSVFVALNSMNESLCPSCNLHQLCLYRDPGHKGREEKELYIDPSESVASPVASAAPRQLAMGASSASGGGGLWSWMFGPQPEAEATAAAGSQPPSESIGRSDPGSGRA